MVVCGQRHAVAALPPRKQTWYPLYRKLNRSPPGFDTRSVQPVASRHTDCAILAHTVKKWNLIKMFYKHHHHHHTPSTPPDQQWTDRRQGKTELLTKTNPSSTMSPQLAGGLAWDSGRSSAVISRQPNS